MPSKRLQSLLVVALSWATTAHAQEPTSREAALDLAWQHHEARRYVEAAKLLEQLSPLDGLLHLGAAESWAHACELTSAESHLAQALADPGLPASSRLRAEALLARVRAASPHAARARLSAPNDAARAWEAAFSVSELGCFLVRAGDAWELAHRPQNAIQALGKALRRDDLPAADAELVPAQLAALQMRLPPPPPDRTAAWITTGLGAASFVFGAGAFLAAEAHRDDVRDALRAPLVTSMTRAEAQQKEALSEGWNLAGWIGLGAGFALTTTGIALFSSGPSAPTTSTSVRLEATWNKDGPQLVTRGTF